MSSETETTRLVPVTKWNEHHEWPTAGGLRHLIFRAKPRKDRQGGVIPGNGLEVALIRIGCRILIDEVKTKRGSAAGFSLLEALMGLTIVAIGVMSIAPVFVYSIRANAVGAEVSSASALAVERMETLRSEHYALLDPGGDLDLDVTGYADDSHPDYIVRWKIVG